MSGMGHEAHNKLAADLAMKLWGQAKDTEDRLVVLESIAAAVIGLMTRDLPEGQRSEARQGIANILSVGIKERLETQK